MIRGGVPLRLVSRAASPLPIEADGRGGYGEIDLQRPTTLEGRLPSFDNTLRHRDRGIRTYGLLCIGRAWSEEG